MSEPLALGMTGKERLLAAASELFASNPFEEVGVAALLALAGVQAPTLYHHFGDKEGLYVSWAEASLSDLKVAMHDVSVRYPDFRESLVAIAATLTSFDGADLLQIMRDSERLRSEEGRERVLKAYMESVHEPVCAVLLKGMETGKLAHESLGKTASAFVLGALSSKSGLPGATPASDPLWWTDRFLLGFGA